MLQRKDLLLMLSHDDFITCEKLKIIWNIFCKEITGSQPILLNQELPGADAPWSCEVGNNYTKAGWLPHTLRQCNNVPLSPLFSQFTGIQFTDRYGHIKKSSLVVTILLLNFVWIVYWPQITHQSNKNIAAENYGENIWYG